MDAQTPRIVDLDTGRGVVPAVRREGWLTRDAALHTEQNSWIFCNREGAIETIALVGGLRLDNLGERSSARTLARRACEIQRCLSRPSYPRGAARHRAARRHRGLTDSETRPTPRERGRLVRRQCKRQRRPIARCGSEARDPQPHRCGRWRRSPGRARSERQRQRARPQPPAARRGQGDRDAEGVPALSVTPRGRPTFDRVIAGAGLPPLPPPPPPPPAGWPV